MTAARFTTLSTVIFGVVILYAGGRVAVGIVRAAGDPGTDAMRLAIVAIAVDAGLLCLRPSRAVAIVRHIAMTTGTDLARGSVAVVLFASMFLTFAVPDMALINLAAIAAMWVCFVYTGLIYADVPIQPESALSLAEVGALGKVVVDRIPGYRATGVF